MSELSFAQKEHKAIVQLSQKKDARLDMNTKTIEIISNNVWSKEGGKYVENPNLSSSSKDILGNGSWGNIDFLVNSCGWYLVRVADFKNKK